MSHSQEIREKRPKDSETKSSTMKRKQLNPLMVKVTTNPTHGLGVLSGFVGGAPLNGASQLTQWKESSCQCRFPWSGRFLGKEMATHSSTPA